MGLSQGPQEILARAIDYYDCAYGIPFSFYSGIGRGAFHLFHLLNINPKTIGLLLGSLIASIGSGMIILAPKSYSYTFYLSIDNGLSDHPLETVKNPAYLNRYISEAVLVTPHSESSHMASALCHYSLDIKTYSIYICQVSSAIYRFADIAPNRVSLKRLWVPRYPHDSGSLFGAVLTNLDESSLDKAAYTNLIDDLSHKTPSIDISSKDLVQHNSKTFAIGLLLLLGSSLFGLISAILFRLNVKSSPKALSLVAIQASIIFIASEGASRLFATYTPDAFPHLGFSRFLVLLANSWEKSRYKNDLAGLNEGESLRDYAWSKTYSEFSVDEPPGGRREKYFGESLEFQRPCGPLSICWAPIFNDAIQIDEHGYQYSSACSPKKPSSIDILVVGGSVAEGAHASVTSATWWSIFTDRLSQLSGTSVCTGVLALGGAESDWELQAVKVHLLKHSPKVILLMDGLNDIIKRHSSDSAILQRHTNSYIVNTSSIAVLSSAKGVVLAQALQPSLFDKMHLSATEKLLLVGYLPTAGHDRSAPARVFKPYLDQIAAAGSLADWNSKYHLFMDMRNTFDIENRTLFGDIWHFQDPAHYLLGHSLANRLYRRMERLWL